MFQRLIIWAFDVGDFDAGITWADLAIAQGQRTPEQHQARLGPFCGRHRVGVGREASGRGACRRAMVLPGVRQGAQ
ncbi:phage terminase small subunit [Aeromonas hydrophila]|nr:phage terminase small subunit [Aeromonas hydrophila]